MNNYEENYIIY